MPLPHSPTLQNATPNPEQEQRSSKTQSTRLGPRAPLLDTSRRPARVSHLRPLSSPSPALSLPTGALSFYFPFTVGNLTSPLSAFRLFLHWSSPPLYALQPCSRSTDYFYFCPINSSVMVLWGDPTAADPPAVDTSPTDSLLSFGHPVL